MPRERVGNRKERVAERIRSTLVTGAFSAKKEGCWRIPRGKERDAASSHNGDAEKVEDEWWCMAPESALLQHKCFVHIV